MHALATIPADYWLLRPPVDLTMAGSTGESKLCFGCKLVRAVRNEAEHVLSIAASMFTTNKNDATALGSSSQWSVSGKVGVVGVGKAVYYKMTI
jgi:hypothetical protein